MIKVDITYSADLSINSSLKMMKRNERDPYKDIEENGLLLYQRDKKTEYFSLILDGKCEIYAGRQGFRSTLSRWTYLCPDALDHVEHSVLKGRPILDYVPDFTCKVVENARVLRIKLSDFKACIQGQFNGLINNDFRTLDRGFSEPAILPNHHTLNIPQSKDEPDLTEHSENSENSEISNNANNANNRSFIYSKKGNKDLLSMSPDYKQN